MQSLCRVTKNFRYLRYQRLCSTNNSGKSSTESSEFKVRKIVWIWKTSFIVTIWSSHLLASWWANKLLHERMWALRLDRLRQRSDWDVRRFWWDSKENYTSEDHGSFNADFSENGTRPYWQEAQRAVIVRNYSNQATEVKKINSKLYL